MSETNFCVNCKHVEIFEGDRVRAAFCSLSVEQPDLVWGGTWIATQVMETCRDFRKAAQPCGPEGKLFERK